MVSFKVDNLKNMNAELKVFLDFLRAEGVCDDDIFASRLVACELITNVIRHGGDEACFTGCLQEGSIEITVTAESLRGLNLNRPIPDIFCENGRGLYIVNCICRTLTLTDTNLTAIISISN